MFCDWIFYHTIASPRLESNAKSLRDDIMVAMYIALFCESRRDDIIFLIPRKIPDSNIFRCFLREKCMIPIFHDVFSEKNTCFKYFPMFSPGKMYDSNIFRCFLREKCMIPIFHDVFSEKNTCFQYFPMFSPGKMYDSNIS